MLPGMTKTTFNIIMVSFIFSFCSELVLKVLRLNSNLIIVIVLASKLYSLFIPMGDESHGADDADKLFTCIAGSGNLSHVLLLIHAGPCSCSYFGIVFCFILKCLTLATVCLI